MNLGRYRVLAVLSFSLVTLLAAQTAPAPDGAKEDHVVALKQSLQKSMAALRGYQWVETTVVSMKGDEKSRTQNSCYYGADGKVQKTPIGTPPESSDKKKRGLRGKIVENKTEEVSDSMKDAIALVKQYVPPDPAKIQAAKDGGRLSLVPPDSAGVMQIVIKDYLKQGDSLTLAVNAAADLLSQVSVSSYTDEAKNAVNLKVQFGTLIDETIYAQKIDLEVAKEDLGVEITNSGYEKKGD